MWCAAASSAAASKCGWRSTPKLKFPSKCWKPPGQPGLMAIAECVVRESQAVEPMARRSRSKIIFAARAIMSTTSTPDIVRTPDTDPIEDFVVNHRTGHCQYSATPRRSCSAAKAFPLRMVVGYHGGEFNSLGSHYLVRQKHAHAWVEAYRAGGEHPWNQLATGSDDPGTSGAWPPAVLTPPDYDLEVEDGETTLLAQIGDTPRTMRAFVDRLRARPQLARPRQCDLRPHRRRAGDARTGADRAGNLHSVCGLRLTVLALGLAFCGSFRRYAA